MLKRIIKIGVRSVIITLGIAVILVRSDPVKELEANKSLDFDAAMTQDFSDVVPTQTVQMRDG